MGDGGSAPRPGRFTPGKDPGTHCTVGWVGPGPVWTGAENLAPTGIRSPDRMDSGTYINFHTQFSLLLRYSVGYRAVPET